MNSFFRKFPAQARIPAIFVVFGIIYGLISLVNHYSFRTYALDLGMVNQAIFDYAHFRKSITTLLFNTPPTNFLSSHFTLIPPLVSPLYWLFGNYTMLLVQIGAILLGGLGVYKLTCQYTVSPYLRTGILLFFFLQWGIFSALSYDYHDNVVGAMFLPWFLLYFERRRFGLALLFFLLLVCSKENMALWAFFIAAGTGLKHYRDKQMRIICLSLMAFSLVYFWVITNLVMPNLDTLDRGFAQLGRYQHLGQTPSAIVFNLLTDPVLLWQQLFTNTDPSPNYDYIKLELYAMLLLSGGLAFLRRPWYLVMAIPIVGQKVLSSDYSLWGLNGQYSIEFAPLLTLALLETLLLVKSDVARKRLLAGSLVVILAATVFTLHKRQSKWFDKAAIQFFAKKHYRSAFDTKKIYALLETIPDNVPVSAQTCFTPHLEKRQKLYHFPVISDAEYVLATKNNQCLYPLNEQQHVRMLDSLRHVPNFKILYEDEQAILFQRQ